MNSWMEIRSNGSNGWELKLLIAKTKQEEGRKKRVELYLDFQELPELSRARTHTWHHRDSVSVSRHVQIDNYFAKEEEEENIAAASIFIICMTTISCLLYFIRKCCSFPCFGNSRYL